MSDTRNLQPSQKREWNGVYVSKHTAKLIKESLENEKSPLMPDENGIVKATPITNANTGWCLNAKDLIPAQLTRLNGGYESTVVGTKQTMDKSSNSVQENQVGLFFNFKGQDGEYHHSAYFFPEQTLYPANLIDFSEKQSKKNAKLQQVLSNETIKVENAKDYLPAYIASAKSGAKLEVSPEVASEFKNNMLPICNNELTKTTAEKNPNISKLSDVMFEADKKALDLIQSVKKERNIGQEKQNAPKKEIKHDRSDEVSR